MAEERKVFPVEQILELVAGKDGADVKSLVCFLTGNSTTCPASAMAAAPFAAAWLARWYPKFMDMEYKAGENWDAFVRQAKHAIGDNISITPMSGRLQALAKKTMDIIAETQAELSRQTDAALALEKEVKALKPLEGRLATAQKKCDDLETRLKTMKTEMNALNRKNLEFEGKIAMDQDQLMQTIKDAIKDNLKGMAVGVAAASVATAETATGESAPAASSEPAEEFGFGGSGPDADGFGF